MSSEQSGLVDLSGGGSAGGLGEAALLRDGRSTGDAAMPTNDGDSGTPVGEPVISVRGVGKRYEIYAKPFDRLKKIVVGGKGTIHRSFWALRDVSFDIHRGDAVGILGRNGSGKSTLLQIISGTLVPTTGEVRIRGRVAALLELGSGFNPQFTGRENVFLSGAILGISRREMEERFDEIAAFADIGDFMEQPVQVYSSGMHARLAFAVSIMVKPDILILDEILAVGDAGFQQKCIARLRQLLDSGVTLLFVSHSPDAVRSVCNKGVLLEQSRVAFVGPSEQAVDLYMSHIRDANTQQAKKAQPKLADKTPRRDEGVEIKAALRYGEGHAQVRSVRVLNAKGAEVNAFEFDEEVTVEVAFRAERDLERLDLVVGIRDKTGVDLFACSAMDEDEDLPDLRAGEGLVVRYSFRSIFKPGAYGVSVTLTRRPDRKGEGTIVLDHLETCAAFSALKPLTKRQVRFKVQLPVKIDCQPLSGGAAAAQ